jgi:sugar lactone lactonase YvrE
VLDSALSWAALNAGANYADGITSDGNGNIYWAFDGGGTYLINKWIVSTSKDNAFENRAYGNIGGIAADATNVVFSEPKNSWMLAAGPPISAFEGGLTNPGRVAAAGGYFYYVVGGNGGTSGTGAIHRAADGTLTSPTTVAAGLNQPVYIATDGANVYWSDTADGAIYRVPVAGGVPFPLVKQAGAAALTTDGTYLYFVNSTTSQILRVPK